MVMKLLIFIIKKIPKVDSSHTCLAVISLDSAHNSNNFSNCSYSDESDEECIRSSSFLRNMGHYFSNKESTQKKQVAF